MELSAVIVFSLVLVYIKDGYADDRLRASDRRVSLAADSADDTKSTMLDKELEWSQKEELNGPIVPPLINRQVKQAISDIMMEDYIGTIISAHVLKEVHSLRANVQNITTQFKALSQKLRHVEQERNMYREDLGKVRDELNKTNRQNVKKMNRILRKTRKGVQSCRKNMKEMQQRLHADVDRINTELNRTILDLSGTRKVMDGLTHDVTKLTTCCVMRNETAPGSTTVSTDPSQDLSLSTMVPPVTVTTQDSDQHVSTDPSQDLSLSTTVPPVTVTTQDSDQHATSSPAAGRELYYASKAGDLKNVWRVLSAGHVDINYRGGPRGRTPVMAAAREGHKDVLEFLVGQGADLSMVDEVGYNILHVACNGVGDLETVKLILSQNVVDINSRAVRNWTPVMWAANRGHTDVVAFLVSQGAYVDKAGYNILHMACFEGHLETVKLIVSQNLVDVNSRRPGNRTPVMWAAWRGYRDVVEFLLGHGADASLVDKEGNTILHLACMGGDLETVKLILSWNVVDVNARNNLGVRAAGSAWGHPQVSHFMKSHGYK